MADTGISSSELLLNNLYDHQVIRIEGSQPWLENTLDQVKAFHPDCYELSGDLTLESIQKQLGDHLDVEANGAFIQKALKQRLENEQKMLLIVNVETVDESALTYLLGLPSICDETGSSVTVLLVTTSHLLSVLKSSTTLSGKLDGYYQEEKEVSGPAQTKTYGVLGVVAGVVVLAAGAWYVTQGEQAGSSIEQQITPAQQTSEAEVATISEEKNPEEKVPVKHAPVKPDSEAGQVADSTAVAPLRSVTETVESVSPVVIDEDQPIAEESVVSKPLNEKLVAELSDTVELANKRKLSQSVKQESKTQSAPGEQATALTVEEPIVQPGLPESTEETAPDNVPVLAVVATESGEVIAKPAEKSLKSGYPSVAQLNNEAEVRKVFLTWSEAWGRQDWDSYIGSYLQNTTLYGVKMSLEEWRAFRKDRLLSPAWLKLDFGEPKYTRLNTHWYRVEFYQRFEKPGYADETTKRLELTLTSSGWKIASEATQGTIVLKRGQ